MYVEEDDDYLSEDDLAFLEALFVVAMKEKSVQAAASKYKWGCFTGIFITASLSACLMTPKPWVKSIIKHIPNPVNIEQRVKFARSFGRFITHQNKASTSNVVNTAKQYE